MIRVTAGVRLTKHSLPAAFILACSGIGFSQVTASMTGKIEDPSGAAIAETIVTVTSLETGAARAVTSDQTGVYNVVLLPVGRYDVKAEKPGFKAAIETGINLVVGQRAVVNLRLEVGATQEQVTVTGEAPLVNTTIDSVSGLVGEQQVKNLPLNGRSFDLLIALNPSIIQFNQGIKDNTVQGGNQFSVAGKRPGENLTFLNGIEYAGAGNLSTTPGGASGQLLGIDAVREYNVVSDTYGAEYGKRGGGQVFVVTQSGTNQLHGTLFEFLRNSDLDARNFFEYPTIGPFKRNNFGGAAGGPIRKDKMFIFGNYEGLRQRLSIPTLSVVPNLNARQGSLPCGSNGVTCAPGAAVGTPTPVPGLQSAMLPFMNLWPAPNGLALGGTLAQSFNNVPQAIRQDFGTLRFDEQFSSKDSLSLAYTIDDGLNKSPSSADPLFGTTTDIRNQVLSVQETRVFSPGVVNSFTAGVTRAFYHAVSSTLGAPPAGTGFVLGKPPGAITIGAENAGSSAVSPVGSANPDVLFHRTLFTYSDGIQIIRGRHQISAGVWFQRIRSNDADPSRAYGQAVFANLASMLQGNVSNFTVAPSATELGWRSWDGAWYLQDALRVRSNLTVRVGIRHEFSGGWNEATGRAASYAFVNGVIQTPPIVGDRFTLQNNAKRLFGPRLGIAWDVFGNGKTSIRTAAGIYYDLMDELFYLVDSTQPFNAAATLSNVSILPLIPVNPATPVPPACGPNVPRPCTLYSPKGVENNFKIPAVYSWNFAVEQQLSRNMALRVGYLGYQETHQATQMDPNQVHALICSNPAGCVAGGVSAFNAPTNASKRSMVPLGAEYVPVTTRPNPYLSNGIFNTSNGNANYNALQADLNKRLSRGLLLRANYTWSKTMDMGTALTNVGGANVGGGVMDITNLKREWSPSTFDVTHQFSANFLYELPFGQGKSLVNGVHGVAEKLVSGWRMNGIMTRLSGFPGTVGTGSNNSGTGNASAPDRPNMAPGATTNNPTSGVTAGCGPEVPAGQRLGTPQMWFDPCAFSLPKPGTFGNVGRGTIRGPGLFDLDISFLKTTPISDRVGLQFRAELFNILNHTNFGFPSMVAFDGNVPSSAAGLITNTATSSRQIQFGLKLNF
jgi:Carboxypeptidase regulatory-like domain